MRIELKSRSFIDRACVEEVISDCCTMDPKMNKQTDHKWFLDYVQEVDVTFLIKRFEAEEIQASVINPSYFNFEEAVSKDALFDQFDLLDLENIVVEETADPRCFAAFVDNELDELPDDLLVTGILGTRTRTAPGGGHVSACQSSQTAQVEEALKPIWLLPFFSSTDVLTYGASWKSSLSQKKIFTKSPGFRAIVVNESPGAVGLAFDSDDNAKAFIDCHRGKINLSLAGGRKAQEYTMSMFLDSSASCTMDAPMPPCVPQSYPETPQASTTLPDTNVAGPEPMDVDTTPELPPLLPDVIRVHMPYGQYKDVPVQSSDTMLKVYAATAVERGQGGIIVSYLSHDEAIPRAVPAIGGTEVALLPCMSVPIVLPTEVKMTVIDGDKDIGLARMKELLCNSDDGEYHCFKRDGGEYVFQHRSKRPHRSVLTPVVTCIKHLGDIIGNRKVGFLSASGKPREGKSTLLALIQRHFSLRGNFSAKGSPIPFQCSDSESRPCTAGLWVSTQELTQCCKTVGRRDIDSDSVVLELDSEGLFAADGNDPEYFVRIFTITTVLSSCAIFNNKISNIVSEEFRAPLARLAALFSGFAEQNPWIRQHQPRLLYLARDWNCCQDLHKDLENWMEAERLASISEQAEDQGFDNALSFTKRTFGPVRFATLPSPVEGISKEGVANKPLHPDFETKLKSIIVDVIEPALIPKSFKLDSGETSYIRGWAPLLQLISNTVDAVSMTSDSSFRSMDWKNIVTGFVKESALHRVDWQAKVIADDAQKTYSNLRIAVPDGIDPANIHSAAKKAGLDVLELNSNEFKMQGSPSIISNFIISDVASNVLIKPPAVETLKGFLEAEQAKCVDDLQAHLAPFGYEAQHVSKLLNDRVQELSGPLMDLTRDMVIIISKNEIKRVRSSCEKDLQSAGTLVSVTSCKASALRALRDLEGRFCECDRVAELVKTEERHITEMCDSILERRDEVVKTVVQKHFQHTLGLFLENDSVHATLDIVLKNAPGDSIFDPSWRIPNSNDAMLADSVRDALASKDEPCFVQSIPSDEKRRLTGLQCRTAESLVKKEREQRLSAEMHRLLKPFDISHEYTDVDAISILTNSNWEKHGIEHNMVGTLQQTFGRHISGDREYCITGCDAILSLVERDPPYSSRLGQQLASSLQSSITTMCQHLKQKAGRDFQVALCSPSKETLESHLKDVANVKHCGIELLKYSTDSASWFRVLLSSQTELDKIISVRRDGFQPFQDFGMRPPPIQWVADRSESVAECWKQYVDPASSGSELIFTSDFKEKVADLFPGKDVLLAKNTRVEVKVRLPFLAYPVPSGMTKEVAELLAPGSKCVRFVVMGRHALIVIEARPSTYEDYQQSKEVQVRTNHGDILDILVMRGPPESEWVWAEPPLQLKTMWDSTEAKILTDAKEQLMRDVRSRGVPKGCRREDIIKDGMHNLLQARGVNPNPEALNVILQRATSEISILHLEAEAATYLQSLCALLEVSQDNFPALACPVQQDRQTEADLSDEAFLRRSMQPIVTEMETYINSNESLDWLSTITKKKYSSDGLLAEYQGQLQQHAVNRAQEVSVKRRLCRFADLMGIQGEQKNSFLYHVRQCDPQHNGYMAQLVSYSFWFGGRRFVPEEMLHNVEEDVVSMVRTTCKMLGDMDEFQSSQDLRSASELLKCPAWKPHNNKFVYLLPHSTDLLDLPSKVNIIGFKMTRLLPCRLRTNQSPLDAFSYLDKMRPDAFVTAMKDNGDSTEVTLSLWHKCLCQMKLPGFQLLHMKLAKRMYGRRHAPTSGFVVSTSESVFFATNFDTTAVDVPAEAASNVEDLLPCEYEVPAKLPDESIDAGLLCSYFISVDQQDVDSVKGREWCPSACKNLLSRFGGNQDAERAIRIAAMLHTRSICDDRCYVSGGKTINFPPPGQTYAPKGVQAKSDWIRFHRTNVIVTNLDTVTAVQKTREMSPSSRILALNMANRNTAGGGYKKGSSAQEEDLFRRTDLSSRLSQEYCRDDSAPKYPLEEFVPIITEGVIAFRGQEKDGYPLLDTAFRFDVISVAAYNANRRGGQSESFPVVEGQGKDNRFTTEGFWRTSCNIYATLAAAAQHRTDRLILSALGCGAFMNPRHEVADIFAQLLPCFGGCFETVEFAIYDPKMLPESNCHTFEKALPSVLSQAKTIGCDWLHASTVCPNLAWCDHIPQGRHGCSQTHPDWCPNFQNCSDQNIAHRRLYRHKQKCTDPNCKVMFGPQSQEYEMHNIQYMHREICFKEQCTSPQHLHPPPCPLGVKCSQQCAYHDDGYWYSHCITACRAGTYCQKWDDVDHLRSFSHPFVNPCRTPILCKHQDQEHRSMFAHFCQEGQDCKKQNDKKHTKFFIHPQRPICPDGLGCTASHRPHYEDHLNIFYHPHVKLCRPLCSNYRMCAKSHDVEHVNHFAHATAENALPPCMVWGHNTTRHLMEEREAFSEVHFHTNAKEMIERVKKWSFCKDDPPALERTAELFRSFRAVHRLSVPSFSKVLQTGFLASLHCLQTHSKHADFAMMLPTVASVTRSNPRYAVLIQEAVESTISQQSENGHSNIESNLDIGQGRERHGERGGSHVDDRRKMRDSRKRWAQLSMLDQMSVQAMKEETENFLKNMEGLEEAQKKSDETLGIEHDKDRIFETNKMVFAILGPHTLNYGEDKDDEHCEGVHLIFSLPALHHPDVYITPQAATFYNSGLADKHRPWWSGSSSKKKDPYDAMAQEKLHPSSPLCHKALAWEFLARVAAAEQKPLKAVTEHDMLKYWKENNAHFMAECHLPYVTPLTFVESVVVSKHSFDKLQKVDQQRARNVFKDRLKVVSGSASQQQWKDAMAIAKSPPPQAFSFTFLPTRTSEVILPVTIIKNRGQIFFRASLPYFSVSLASGLNESGVAQHAYTFTVAGVSVTVTKGNDIAAPLKQHDRFNRDLRLEGTVMYCLEFKREWGGCTLVLRHAGASRTWNAEQVSIQCTDSLKVVKFESRGSLISFTDVRVLYDQKYAYEYERTWEVPAAEPPPAPMVVPAQQPKKDGSSGWMTRMFSGWMGGTDCEVQPLCEYGMRCAAAYGTAESKLTAAQRSHLDQYRHLCRHGSSCDAIGDAEHNAKYMHLDKKVCHASSCELLDDFAHRLEYHHLGYWDLLMSCRRGNACQQRKDPRHVTKYHHLQVEYKIDENGLQIQDASDDRGGSSKGDMATNMDVDSHPTQTDSTKKKGGIFRMFTKTSGGSSGSQDQPSYDFSGIDVEVQDSVDDMGEIYNMGAVNGEYADAEKDQYGNPIGGGFDLAKDGSFKGFRLLVGCFYCGEGLRRDLDRLTIPELSKKGWDLQVEEHVTPFTDQMKYGKFHAAWIISNTQMEGDADAFTREVRRFHEAGRGLMIWGDNHPYFAHANQILQSLFNFHLMGNTPGGTELLPGDPSLKGKFGKHLIASGITKINEGVTICYPDHVPADWTLFGTSSDGHPVLLAKDAVNVKTGPGRVVVDNGFTKLMQSQWTSAGTPRYVSNCCAWLALRERFKGPMRGFNGPPRQ